MQTEIPDPYRLKLKNADAQEKVNNRLCEIIRDVVAQNEERNRQLRAYRWQLEGYSQPNQNLPWPGACQIESTISRELHTTTTAAIWSGVRQEPKVAIESITPTGVDRASQTETYLNLKAQQFNIDAPLYDAVYLANEGRYSVLYQYSDQSVHRWFDLLPAVYEENPDGPPVLVSEAQIVLREEPKDFCVKFRVPDPWDFYVYPSEAKGPEVEDGALLNIEKMYLTAEDLSLGAMYEGYTVEAVKDMLKLGPQSLQDEDDTDREDEFLSDGIDTATQSTKEGQMWQCFQVIGRMPPCFDEGNAPIIPDELLHVDCLWMVCPALNIVFKQAYSPCPQGMRPYTVFNVLKKPNRMLGEGICSMISPLHEEITAIERFGINNMNLEASPVMTVAEGWLMRYPKWTIAPGRFMPRQTGDPVGPKPLTWDIRSQQLIMPWKQDLDNQASRIAASQGVNSGTTGKVVKAAQVHFAESMQQTKFDLYLTDIQSSVVKVYEKLRLQLIQHMNESGSEADVAYSGGTSVEIDKDALSETYRFFAQGATDSLTPAARLAKQQVVDEIVTSYWLGVQQWQMVGCLGYIWKLKYRLLVMAGERMPESLIGPDPGQMTMPGGTPPGIPPLGMPMMPLEAPGGGGVASGQMGAGVMAGGGMMQSSGMNGNGAH